MTPRRTYFRWLDRLVADVAAAAGGVRRDDEVWFEAGRNEGFVEFVSRGFGPSVSFFIRIGVISARLWEIERQERVRLGLTDERSSAAAHLILEPDRIAADGTGRWECALAMSLPEWRDVADEIRDYALEVAIPRLHELMRDEDIRDFWLAVQPPRRLGPGTIERLALLLADLGPADALAGLEAEREIAARDLEDLRAEAWALRSGGRGERRTDR